MKIKDSINQYLDDLPNRWSANFLALFGLINFITIILGSIQSVYYRVTNKSVQLDLNFVKDLYLNIEGTINHIWNCFSSPKEEFLIVMFLYSLLIFFSKTKISLKICLFVFSTTLVVYFIDVNSIYNFMYSGEVGTLFKPTYGYSYPIMILFAYLLFSFIEKFFKINTPKTLLKKYELYRLFLNIFVNYSCFILILLSVLTLLN